jgi:ribosomal subunit interface protein
MEPRITADKLTISPAIRERAEHQFAKLQRFSNPIIDCQIHLSQAPRTCRAEWIVQEPHKVLVGEASEPGDNLFRALDAAFEKILIQSKKHHGKLTRVVRPD